VSDRGIRLCNDEEPLWARKGCELLMFKRNVERKVMEFRASSCMGGQMSRTELGAALAVNYAEQVLGSSMEL
jgi:hypothetical protein